jgi:hypothetical protein
MESLARDFNIPLRQAEAGGGHGAGAADTVRDEGVPPAVVSEGGTAALLGAGGESIVTGDTVGVVGPGAMGAATTGTAVVEAGAAVTLTPHFDHMRFRLLPR